MKKPSVVKCLTYAAAALSAGSLIMLLWLDPPRVAIPSDGYWYASLAINLTRGLGFVDTDLAHVTIRPLFPLFLSLSFAVFGISAITAIWVTRVIFIGMLGVIYLVGRELGARYTGLLAALLCMTSYSVTNWATLVHLDVLLPTLMLAYVLIVYWSFEKDSIVLFIISGFVLGLAYLTKEVAALYAPLPFVWIALRKEYRTMKMVWRAFTSMLPFATLFVAWQLYLYMITGTPQYVFGVAAPQMTQRVISGAAGEAAGLGQTLAGLIGELLLALPNYYTIHLAPNFLFAPLLVIGVIFTTYQALRGSKQSQYLLLAILLFSPIVILQGVIGLRTRQSVLFILLAYISTADMLMYLTARVTTFNASSNLRTNLITVPILSVVLIALPVSQFMADEPATMPNLLTKYSVLYRVLTGEPDDGYQVAKVENELGNWFLQHAPAGSRVMTMNGVSRPLYFYSNGMFPVSDYLPAKAAALAESPYPSDTTDVIWLDFDTGGNQNLLSVAHVLPSAITQSDLLNYIMTNDIQYVVLHRSEAGLNTYFLNHPDFVKVAESDKSAYHVFQRMTARPRLISHPFVLGPRFKSMLKRIQTEDTVLAQEYIDANLSQMLGLEADELKAVVAGNHPASTLGSAGYSYHSYSDFVAASSYQEQARQAAQEQQATNPANPWPYVTLASNCLEDALSGSAELPSCLPYTQVAITLDPTIPDLLRQIDLSKRLDSTGASMDEFAGQLLSIWQNNQFTDTTSLWAWVELFSRTNQPALAIDLCKTLELLETNSIEPQLCVARTSAQANAAEQALEYYRKVLDSTALPADTYPAVIAEYLDLFGLQHTTEDTAQELERYKRIDADLLNTIHLELGKRYLHEYAEAQIEEQP